jgi:hypothetical protein
VKAIQVLNVNCSKKKYIPESTQHLQCYRAVWNDMIDELRTGKDIEESGHGLI